MRKSCVQNVGLPPKEEMSKRSHATTTCARYNCNEKVPSHLKKSFFRVIIILDSGLVCSVCASQWSNTVHVMADRETKEAGTI